MDTYEGSQDTPLSLHKYLYGYADPVNRSDPSGHDSLEELSAVNSIQGDMMANILPSVARGGANALISVGRTGARLAFGEITAVDPVAMLLAQNVAVSEAALIAAATSLAATPTLIQIEELEDEARGQIVYRAMRGDKMPTIGDASSLELGVRDGSQGGGNDVENIMNGMVQPTAQGMSVTPDFPAFLPTFALKAVAQKKAKVWGYYLGVLDSRLTYRPDPGKPKQHGFIGVTAPMPLSEFRNLIHATQPGWVPFPPQD
jgi:hypothetical protein